MLILHKSITAELFVGPITFLCPRSVLHYIYPGTIQVVATSKPFKEVKGRATSLGFIDVGT